MNKRIDLELTLVNKLSEIQRTLNAPKSQYNSFGKYSYRSCEDILMAVKPLLGDLILTVNDEIVLVGDRIYVKSTATISDGKDSVSTSAYAREAEAKKGMDDAQLTGATSSYARKYALNGLLLIDDNKDADSTNKHGKDEQESTGNGKGVIKPTDGAGDKLTTGQRREIEEFAEGIQVHFDAGMDIGKIVESLEEMNYPPDHKVYCWGFLDSKLRSAIKEYQEEAKHKAINQDFAAQA